MATVDVHDQKPLEARRELGGCCGFPRKALRFDDRRSLLLSRMFKALGDPARLQILDILSQRSGEVCVCDLEGTVGLPDEATGERPKQPTISHHLRVLRESGLIDSRKQGQWVYYFLRVERLEDVRVCVGLLAGPAAKGGIPG
ncbi:MAG TPA: metalloregulator ArsR/SmtB family transcription factor [Rectinemataceae bacterium]|nr:metalloregulator ArsR/SmtB family transcription factor [Rectinemataceae bacterium]